MPDVDRYFVGIIASRKLGQTKADFISDVEQAATRVTGAVGGEVIYRREHPGNLAYEVRILVPSRDQGGAGVFIAHAALEEREYAVEILKSKQAGDVILHRDPLPAVVALIREGHGPV